MSYHSTLDCELLHIWAYSALIDWLGNVVGVSLKTKLCTRSWRCKTEQKSPCPPDALHSSKGWHCRKMNWHKRDDIWELEAEKVSLRWGCLSWSLNKKNPQMRKDGRTPRRNSRNWRTEAPESRNTCMSHKTRTDRQGCHIPARAEGIDEAEKTAQATPVKAF